MGVLNTFTSILKLIVIIVNLYHFQMSLQTVNGMEIIPLWNDTSSSFYKSCIINNLTAEQGFVSVQSSAHDICRLQINSSSDHNIFMEISGSVNSEIDFLYIDRLDNGLHCPYRYVAINVLETCGVTFIHDQFQVNFKGNISLSIMEIEEGKSANECPELSQNISTEFQVSAPSHCPNIQGFDDLRTCSLQSSYFFKTLVEVCWIIFPRNCNVTISKNEAILECPQIDRLLLLYPELMIELTFSFNRIIHIDPHAFDMLPELQALNLEHTNLVALQPAVFEKLHKLRWLSLSYNGFSTFPEDVFKGLINLNYLSISANVLSILPSKLLHDLVKLEEIKLNKNLLSTLNITFFQGLKRLKILDLSTNKLNYLPVGLFKNLSNLRKLLLKNNRLVTFQSAHVQDMESLTSLHLADNELLEVSNNFCEGLKSLKELNLKRNKMSFLDKHTFQGFGNPYAIRLSENLLSEIPVNLFQNLESLRILLLPRNKLTKLDASTFGSLPNLERLHIGSNQLQTISKNLFANLTKLKLLKISDNHLIELDINIFMSLLSLEYLDMSENDLKTIPDLQVLTRLTFLAANQNNITTVKREFLSSLSKNTMAFFSQHEICECYVPKNGMNCSADGDRSPYLTCDRLLSDRILVIAMWLIGLNALVGNMFVLIWKQKRSHANKLKVQSMLLSNLAMSDFLMGVYMILIGSADIYFGESFPMRSNLWRTGVTCKIAGTLSILSSEASVLFVTLISIDRFINIKCPYSTRKLQKGSTIVIVLLSWIFALLLSVVPSTLAGIDFKFYDNSHVCIGLPLALIERYTKHEVGSITFEGTEFASGSSYYEPNGYAVGLFYSSALFLGFNSLCYLLILGCYIEIIRAVRTSSKQSGRNRGINEQITMTMKVAAIVATDFFCWAPIIILGILVQTRIIALGPSVYAWLVTCVVPINSAINPYLYTISELISRYRKTIMKQAPPQILEQVKSCNTTESNLSQTT